MNIIQAILLGLLQGATEFVPVSSSAHLVLVPWLLGWDPPGLLFDTMVHWGTLLAVVAYFWRDWWAIATAWLHSLVRRDWRDDPQARLGWWIILGTIPAAVLGFLFEDFFESLFNRPAWVSFFLLVTAGLLVLAERLGRRVRAVASLGPADALLIGVGQAVAIAPGISRSGATITAGLLRGLTRPAAARFSFMLSSPAILGAGLLQLAKLFSSSDVTAQWPPLAAGLIAAAVSGWLCIWGLLRYLERRSLYPFAVYCAVAGLVCLAIALL